MTLNSIFLNFVLLFISLISCNNKNPKPYDNDNESLSVVDTSFVHVNVNTTETAVLDTVFKDYFYEEILNYGYRFGMPLTEWNKNLATLTKNGEVSELSELTFASERSDNLLPNINLVEGSYQGFIPVDKSENPNKRGFLIKGLFSIAKSDNKSIEVFRLNKRKIKEPILIGVRAEVFSPDSEIKDVINIMIAKDNLQFITGDNILVIDDKPLTVADFSSESSIGKMEKGFHDFAHTKRDGTSDGVSFEIDPNKYENRHSLRTALFQNDLFISKIMVIETDKTLTTRNRDNEIIGINNSNRKFKLYQEIYSKKQYKIDKTAIMTREQKEEYDKSSETQKLMNKALNSQ